MGFTTQESGFGGGDIERGAERERERERVRRDGESESNGA